MLEATRALQWLESIDFSDNNNNTTTMISITVFLLVTLLVFSTTTTAANAAAFSLKFLSSRLKLSKATTTTTLNAPDQTQTTTTTASSTKKSLLRKSLAWWEELAPPFTEDLTDSEEEEEDHLGTIAGGTGGAAAFALEKADVTHFCFLVHGHRGLSKDLSYMQTVMERVALIETRKRWCLQQQQQKVMTTAEEELDNTTPPQATTTISTTTTTTTTIRHELVVHATVCNEKKTDDGVANGGERLVEEILSVIRKEMTLRQQQQQNQPQQQEEDHDETCLKDVTISILGNSLGGIYGRYAIAELTNKCVRETKRDSQQQQQQDADEEPCWILDGKYRLHFNIFCTTATPHLGIAGHTFLPLPRTAEIGVAHAMGNTGKDLFRLNDLMKRMATDPHFLEPLGSFRKRIAYANAYGTDFPVPVHTAAFLSESSTYPHHFLEDNNEEDRLVVDDNGLVIATLHTPRKIVLPSGENNAVDGVDDEDCFFVQQDDEDDLVQMSTRLDALGWKKVFIDIRKQIPKITLPTSLLRRNNNNNSSSNNGSSNATETMSDSEEDSSSGPPATSNNNCSRDQTLEAIDVLKQKGVASSRDLAAAVTAPLFAETFHWPMGHNMIVAFSRTRLSTYINRAGRPVVDSLAAALVEDIFAWTPKDATTEEVE